MTDEVKAVEEEEVVTTPEGEEEQVTTEIDENENGNKDAAVLEMSDEDFEKTIAASGGPAQPAAEEASQEEEAAASGEEKEAPETEVKTEVDPKTEPKQTEVKTDPKDPPKKTETATEEKVDKTETSEIVDPLAVSDEVAVAGYKQLMAPFKANGKTVQARTPEEALRLMQMGAGHIRYQNKMRPLVQQAKTLEAAKIGPSELNYLIELHNKNPDAIKKLVRDAGIDPYDIATDDESKAADKNYRPRNYALSDSQITLDEVLDDIESSDDGKALMQTVQNDWDDGSRKIVAGDPNILHVLLAQKQTGVYDAISDEVERRRTLGEFAKTPFLNAYHQVGTEMEAAGAFKKEPTSETPGQGNGATPAPQPARKSEVIAKKAAAPKQPEGSDAVDKIAPVKKVVTPKTDSSNLLDMSDEEFAKLEGMQQFA